MIWAYLFVEIKNGVITMDKTRIIAVAGKGGVGKTSIAAVMVKVLAAKYPDKKILAIDADPAVGLSTALGIDVEMTIDDIRKKVVTTVEDGDTKTQWSFSVKLNTTYLTLWLKRQFFFYCCWPTGKCRLLL